MFKRIRRNANASSGGTSTGVNGLNGTTNIGLGGTLSLDTDVNLNNKTLRFLDLAAFHALIMDVSGKSGNFGLVNQNGGSFRYNSTGGSVGFSDPVKGAEFAATSSLGLEFFINGFTDTWFDFDRYLISQKIAGANFVDDAAAAAGGVPLNGVYNDNGIVRIRMT